MDPERVEAWAKAVGASLYCVLICSMICDEEPAEWAGRRLAAARVRLGRWYLRQLPKMAPAVIAFHARRDAARVVYEAEDLCVKAAP